MGTKYLPVTTKQTDSICQMANDKEVGRVRFQKALDDGSISRFLDSLKWKPVEIKLSDGTSAQIIEIEVEVEQDCEWQSAVNAAGPNTPSDYNVRKVGDQYTPVGKGKVKEKLILLNFPSGGGSWNKAITWAKAENHKQTNPREALAIGEHHPKLHEQLGQNPMYAVATTDCSFGGNRSACYVWWNVSKRMANLAWVEYFDCANAWFVFRK